MDSIINMKDIHQSNDLKIFNKKDDEVKVSTSIGLTNKKKKIRCHKCNIKCGLFAFRCECGNIYCSNHVTRISHNCIKLHENNEKKKKEIEERNPLTKTSKVEKI